MFTYIYSIKEINKQKHRKARKSMTLQTFRTLPSFWAFCARRIKHQPCKSFLYQPQTFALDIPESLGKRPPTKYPNKNWENLNIQNQCKTFAFRSAESSLRIRGHRYGKKICNNRGTISSSVSNGRPELRRTLSKLSD